MTIIGAEVEAKGTRGLGAWDHVVGVGEVGLELGLGLGFLNRLTDRLLPELYVFLSRRRESAG